MDVVRLKFKVNKRSKFGECLKRGARNDRWGMQREVSVVKAGREGKRLVRCV